MHNKKSECERRVIYGGDWIYAKDIEYIRFRFRVPLECESRPNRQYGDGASFSYLEKQLLALDVEVEPIRRWLETDGQLLPHQMEEARGEADAEKEAPRRFQNWLLGMDLGA